MRRTLAALAATVLLLAGCGSHTAKRYTVRLAPGPAVQPQSAMGSVHPPNWGASVWGVPHRTLAAAARSATSSGTREQYDTITIATIPAGAQFLAGYTQGLWQTFGPLVRAFPHAKVKSIAVFYFGPRVDCGDFEPGDMTPSQAVGWWRLQRAEGVKRPCLYSSLWEFTNQIRPRLRAAGITHAMDWEFDADYIYTPRLDPTFDCTQWNDHAYGRNLDESTCSLAFLGVQPVKRTICFGRGALHTPGCVFVQREVAAWRKQSASDLANAARVVKHWS